MCLKQPRSADKTQARAGREEAAAAERPGRAAGARRRGSGRQHFARRLPGTRPPPAATHFFRSLPRPQACVTPGGGTAPTPPTRSAGSVPASPRRRLGRGAGSAPDGGRAPGGEARGSRRSDCASSWAPPGWGLSPAPLPLCPPACPWALQSRLRCWGWADTVVRDPKSRGTEKTANPTLGL